MGPREAESLVRELYEDDRDKLGYPAVEHVARVAHEVSRSRAFPPERLDDAVATAWLHDAAEDGKLSFRQLYDSTSRFVFEALLRLTRDGKMSYMDYIASIRDTGGDLGRVVRSVKLADLRDNMARPCPPEMEGMRLPGGRYWRAYTALTAGP